LLCSPSTVTTTSPVVAPPGTLAIMDVGDQETISLAGVPLKATLLLPRVAPNPLPVMVTAVPASASAGSMSQMTGACSMLNSTVKPSR
jgi:hypothetical protein